MIKMVLKLMWSGIKLAASTAMLGSLLYYSFHLGRHYEQDVIADKNAKTEIVNRITDDACNAVGTLGDKLKSAQYELDKIRDYVKEAKNQTYIKSNEIKNDMYELKEKLKEKYKTIDEKMN
jgi:hypothetical protein